MHKSDKVKDGMTQSENRLRAIFNQAFEFIGLMKPDGTLIEINQTALDFAALYRHQVIGLPLWETRWWSISKQIQGQLKNSIACAASGQFVRYEVDIVGTGDRVAHLDFSIKPIKDENGQVISLILEGRDITDQKIMAVDAHRLFNEQVFSLPHQCVKMGFDHMTQRHQTEQALHESEARFRATFEQAAVGIAHLALDGRWLRVNQKLCEILGYTHEELLKLTLQDIFHADDLATDTVKIRQLLAGEIQIYSTEKRYIRQNTSSAWINLTMSLLREADWLHGNHEEKPSYLIAVMQDISQRKQAEFTLQQRAEELTRLNTILAHTTSLLQKRNQELDQFVYVASHDLKAPLRAIASLSEWLEEDLGEQLPPDNQHQMRLLRGRVRRMEGLINGLLEYSRVGRNQTELSLVNVEALLREIIDSWELPSTFVIDIAPEMPTFITKKFPLQQVFANLMENAIKHHSRSNGKLKISVQNQGKYYKFIVADDGPGISPEYQDKVFVIFQTLEARDRQENTGIGLAIVKKIVETEGGTITLESQPGIGSTFSFTWLKQANE
ncbi:MAG: PAS domain S-box protein [Nostoc sp. LLA-1]|nr:PAS domain S-box protein [Cyanocohniella sp. LLY]